MMPYNPLWYGPLHRGLGVLEGHGPPRLGDLGQGRHRALGPPRRADRGAREGHGADARHEALHARRRDHPRSLRGRVGGQLGLRPDDGRRVRLHGEGAQARRRARAHPLRDEGRGRGRIPARAPRPERDHPPPERAPVPVRLPEAHPRTAGTSRKARILAMGITRELQGRGPRRVPLSRDHDRTAPRWGSTGASSAGCSRRTPR